MLDDSDFSRLGLLDSPPRKFIKKFLQDSNNLLDIRLNSVILRSDKGDCINSCEIPLLSSNGASGQYKRKLKALPTVWHPDAGADAGSNNTGFVNFVQLSDGPKKIESKP